MDTNPQNISQATLDLMKTALSTPSESLRKSITTGTGLVPFDLQAPAKNLYPVATPLRNTIPRVGGGVGTATNWKSIFSVTGSGYDSMGWVPEGQRAGRMSYSAASKSASYKTLGEEDNMTFEAINAGKTFEDIISTGVVRILQKMMLKEENAIFGGNNTVLLGVPVTPTVSSSGTLATLPTLTYDVAVVALTHEGYRTFVATGGMGAAVPALPLSQTVTGADGQTYVVNGGSSNKSAVATQAVTLGGHLFASTTSIAGAVAYGWYIGGAGAAKLEAVTTINSLDFSTALLGTGQALSAVSADNSKNTLAFDGLLYTAINAYNTGGAGNGAYVKMLATGTAGTGTFLTASGRGSVVEIDDMLISMWNNFQTSPTVLWVNAQEIRNITTKVLNASSGPLLRYDMAADSKNPYALTANGVVEMYFNPYALNGGYKIPIKIHPLVPAGTIIGWAENLPAQYQNNETPNVAEMKIRADYYSLEWPIKTRAREYGVYAEEVLAVYAPFAMGVIGNIGNG